MVLHLRILPRLDGLHHWRRGTKRQHYHWRRNPHRCGRRFPTVLLLGRCRACANEVSILRQFILLLDDGTELTLGGEGCI